MKRQPPALKKPAEFKRAPSAAGARREQRPPRALLPLLREIAALGPGPGVFLLAFEEWDAWREWWGGTPPPPLPGPVRAYVRSTSATAAELIRAFEGRGPAVAARLEIGSAARLPRRRPGERQGAPEGLCGARTRRGTACRRFPAQGRRRCLLHGGGSTGPRTAEGRARIAESNRRRARERRAAKRGEGG